MLPRLSPRFYNLNNIAAPLTHPYFRNTKPQWSYLSYSSALCSSVHSWTCGMWSWTGRWRSATARPGWRLSAWATASACCPHSTSSTWAERSAPREMTARWAWARHWWCHSSQPEVDLWPQIFPIRASNDYFSMDSSIDYFYWLMSTIHFHPKTHTIQMALPLTESKR